MTAVMNRDGGIFAGYVNETYDSSGDYWKLNRDGTLAYDGLPDLYDENGNLIYQSTDRGIQGSLSEILGISPNDAYALMMSANLTWNGKTWVNDANATDGRHIIKMDAKTKSGKTYEDLYKTVRLTDTKTGITGTLEEHNPLNIYNKMVAEGRMQMVGIATYNETDGSFDFYEAPISYEEYKANNFMEGMEYGMGYDMISLQKPLNVTHAYDDFFGIRENPQNKNETHSHTGTDYGVPVGTPFKPYAEGTVSKIETTDGGGNTLRLEHTMSYTYKGEKITTEYYTDYMHMRSNSDGLPDTPFKIGDVVSADSIAGYSGNSGGKTTGAHLHAGLFFPKTNPYVNWLKMQGNLTIPFYGRGSYVDTRLFIRK
jgi:murein DD-endopeptidase MepM/ murein hydrolase activator NlpD